eukprot:CAMPEP_0174727104 /NCGR_PEP_ID=MMETSP1094-20130205/49081_1 /TAXON_ID=156173 /ORGANISM="Chrysochromulina brevifilum, Strain UTEX LB 985" /LENGTH=82 /DNA_ID=CAMNT_0015928779 /DNA_START=141 /DNA_END=389 /DNA_ORIENTATION=+
MRLVKRAYPPRRRRGEAARRGTLWPRMPVACRGPHAAHRVTEGLVGRRKVRSDQAVGDVCSRGLRGVEHVLCVEAVVAQVVH